MRVTILVGTWLLDLFLHLLPKMSPHFYALLFFLVDLLLEFLHVKVDNTFEFFVFFFNRFEDFIL